jgi:DNA topoisomerase-1
LRGRTLTREKVLATVVRLLDTDYLRIGNERYAKENKSFGATTLLCRHVRTESGRMKMRFTGKHGKTKEVVITDRRLSRIVRQCQELPGQSLFQYINGEGVPHPVSSSDVNDYIREATGGDFTAKHFRTWGASVIAFEGMLEAAEEARKISVTTMVEPVAEALGNTVAISRKSYVHPKLVEAVKENPRDAVGDIERPRERKWMSSTELALLKFLERRARPKRKAASG